MTWSPAGRRREGAGDQAGAVGTHRDWSLIAAFFVAGLAPLANAVGALTHGWVPYGDEAIIATRAHDFGTTLTPMLGMPSTFAAVSSHNPTQPGPLQFWALGPFCRLLGPAAGVLIGTATINGLSIVGIGLVAQRLCGRRAALAGLGTALVLVLLVNGPTYSFEPVNSIAPVVPLMFTLTLAWAVASGRLAWLPLLVLAGSFTAQADLEFVGVVLIVGGWAIGALVVQRWRLQRTAPLHLQGGVDEATAGAWRPPLWTRRSVVSSVVIGSLCWSGPLVEAARHSGGNLWETWLAFISPARLLAVTGVERGLGAVLDIPPLFWRDGTSSTRWTHGLDLTAVVSVSALGFLWWRARAHGLPTVQRLVTVAGVTAIAVAANAYRLPVETFAAGHTMFTRGAGGFVWFAGIATALGVTALTGVERWRLPVALAGVAVLVLGLPGRSSSAVVGAGATAIVVSVVAVCLVPLLWQALARRRETVTAGIGGHTVEIWSLRVLGAVAVGVLATSVALPPNLRSAYRGWIYDAIPPLDHQVDVALPVTRSHADAFLVAAAGGDRYRDVAKALISSLEGRETPTLVGDDLVQTYGSRRSYRSHQDKAAGEVLVVPREAHHLPAGAHLIASWWPPRWNPRAVRRLRNDIATFVGSRGRLNLTTEGQNRIPELLAYSLAAPVNAVGSAHPNRYRDHPALLASLPPEVVTNLYAEPWAVATPQLPAALRARLDQFVAAPAIDVWFIPAPLPAGTGVSS